MAWQAMPGTGREESVHLAAFPRVRDELVDAELAARWARIMEVRERVLAALEEARQSGKIAKPLASRVLVAAPDDLYEFLKPYAEMLPSVFIVSQVIMDCITAGWSPPMMTPPRAGSPGARRGRRRSCRW